jgi:hypothetical protein
MSEGYWERDKRITNEFLLKEKVLDYIDEFGLVNPKEKGRC